LNDHGEADAVSIEPNTSNEIRSFGKVPRDQEVSVASPCLFASHILSWYQSHEEKVRELERFAGPSSRRVRGNTTQPLREKAIAGEIPAGGQASVTVRTFWAFPQSDHSAGANYLPDSRRPLEREVRENDLLREFFFCCVSFLLREFNCTLVR
jgi:hypothetical protein